MGCRSRKTNQSLGTSKERGLGGSQHPVRKAAFRRQLDRQVAQVGRLICLASRSLSPGVCHGLPNSHTARVNDSSTPRQVAPLGNCYSGNREPHLPLRRSRALPPGSNELLFKAHLMFPHGQPWPCSGTLGPQLGMLPHRPRG